MARCVLGSRFTRAASLRSRRVKSSELAELCSVRSSHGKSAATASASLLKRGASASARSKADAGNSAGVSAKGACTRRGASPRCVYSSGSLACISRPWHEAQLSASRTMASHSAGLPTPAAEGASQLATSLRSASQKSVGGGTGSSGVSSAAPPTHAAKPSATSARRRIELQAPRYTSSPM